MFQDSDKHSKLYYVEVRRVKHTLGETGPRATGGTNAGQCPHWQDNTAFQSRTEGAQTGRWGSWVLKGKRAIVGGPGEHLPGTASI